MILGIALSVLAGAALWTLTEYLLHRSLGHRKARNPFTVEHLAHHANTSYFAPTWKKAGAVVIMAVVVTPFLWWFGGAQSAAGFGGFLMMYVLYEWVHRFLHTRPPKTRYGRWARRHHFYHHFKRPHKNHGVTTPFWDWVFGTLEVPDHVTVPKKHQLDWMRAANFCDD